MALICSVLSVSSISSPSGLLNLDEETFELRSVGIGINDRRREQVGRVMRCLARIFSDAAIAPVNRNADLISLLAVNHHRLDALGDHRLRHVARARTRHL